MAQDQIDIKSLLDAGVHFGHQTRKWNPKMAPYIFMEKNGIHIIDLHKTAAKMQEVGEALKKIAASGRKIMFVSTKKQAKEIVAENAKKVNMPYITERWPGGMLTNFVTIRKAVKKMSSIDRMKIDGTFETLSKREKLQIERTREKLELNLGSINDMTRLPGAIFVVDAMREHIAVKEARKLGIPIFAMVDTNTDPDSVDFLIPANDDATKSIDKIVSYITASMIEGLENRKQDRERSEEEAQVVQDGEQKPAEIKVEEGKDKPRRRIAKKEVQAEAPVEEVKEEVKAETPVEEIKEEVQTETPIEKAEKEVAENEKVEKEAAE